MRPLAERLWEKVEKSDGCWEWRGTIRRNDARGVIVVCSRAQKPRGNRMALVHRVAWEAEYGPIPEGMKVCHHCDNPVCCRPIHLFLGTDADNVADKMRKGRYGPGNGYRERANCVHGHSFDELNTYWRPNGRRTCRECSRDSKRRRRAA